MSTATTDTDRAARDAARQAAEAEANAAAARRAEYHFQLLHNGMSEAQWTSAMSAPRKRDTGYEALSAGCGLVRVHYSEYDPASPYSWSTPDYGGSATGEGEILSIAEKLANGERIAVPAGAPDFPQAIRATVKRIVEHWNVERARKAEEDRVRAEAKAKQADDERRTRIGPGGRAEEDVQKLSADVARLSADVSVLTSQVAALVAKSGGRP